MDENTIALASDADGLMVYREERQLLAAQKDSRRLATMVRHNKALIRGVVALGIALFEGGLLVANVVEKGIPSSGRRDAALPFALGTIALVASIDGVSSLRAWLRGETGPSGQMPADANGRVALVIVAVLIALLNAYFIARLMR